MGTRTSSSLRKMYSPSWGAEAGVGALSLRTGIGEGGSRLVAEPVGEESSSKEVPEAGRVCGVGVVVLLLLSLLR